MIDIAHFAFERVLAPVSGNVPSNDALRRTVEEFELQVKYVRLSVQLSSVPSKCGTWLTLAHECDGNITSLQALLDLSENRFNLVEGPFAVLQTGKETVAFERDACIGKVGRHQALMSVFQDACSHPGKRLSDEVVGLEAGDTAAANKAEE